MRFIGVCLVSFALLSVSTYYGLAEYVYSMGLGLTWDQSCTVVVNTFKNLSLGKLCGVAAILGGLSYACTWFALLPFAQKTK